MRGRSERTRQPPPRVDCICVDNGARNGSWRNYQMIGCVHLILSILLILSRDSSLLVPSEGPRR